MENDKNKKKPEREVFEDIKFDEILDPTENKTAEREPIPPKKQRRVKKKPLNNRDYVHTYKYYSVEAKEPDVPMKMVDNKEENNNNQALMDFLKLRAEENDIPSVSTLAVLYYSQNKVDEAMSLFETAANAGYAEAERNLAIVLEIGESKETEKIFDLYNKAAEKEDVLALNNLGCCYLNGEGCEQDYKKAVACFDKAAREYDDLAMLNLGNCYSFGLGVRQNLKKAFSLYERAAETGNVEAIRVTADCYFYGRGVKQDLKTAYKYYSKAAEKGDVEAAEAVKKLQKMLVGHKHTEPVRPVSETEKPQAEEKVTEKPKPKKKRDDYSL